MRTKHTTSRAFTLIELLVVTTIISILASLILGGTQVAIKAAHQTRDMNNVKNIGFVLYADAMDNNGRFRVGPKREDTEPNSTTLQVFQGLIDDGLIGDPAVVAGQGSVKAKQLQLTEQNIGFQYIAGYDTSVSARMPLLFTKGVEINKENMTGDSFAVGTSAWKYDGVAVCYVGGNASFIRGRAQNGLMRLSDVAALGQVPEQVVVYK